MSARSLVEWGVFAGGLMLAGGCYSGVEADAPGSDADSAATAGPAGSGESGDGDGSETGDGDSGDDAFAPGQTPMRRLTQAQFLRSIQDLLQLPGWMPSTELPNDGLNEEEFQLPNMVSSSVTTTIVDYGRYREAAKEAVATAFADDDDLQARLGCVPVSATDACIEDYLVALTERAWSREVPSDDPVLIELLAVVEEGTQRLGTPRDGLRWAVSAVLQSPEFLYAYPVARLDDETMMNDHSVARQLALTFRDSVPDAELLELAHDGTLTEPDVLEEQVDRLVAQMIADPQHRGAVHRFFEEWWSMNVIDAIGKDPDAYPEFTETLRDAMKREVDLWIGDIVFESRLDFRNVIVSDRTYVNDELADLYGLDGEFGTEHRAVALEPGDHRSGLLTTGAFLSVMAHPSLTSPAARGKFVSERLLCLEIPPPPPNVDTTTPPPTQAETKRDRFVRHTTDPVCAGCHTLMDPSGLALEQFDAIGRYRQTETVVFDDQEHELEIDPAGELLGQTFDDGQQMAEILADSTAFSSCVTRQLLRHTLGREIEGDELQVAEELAEEFVADDHDFLGLMRSIALHPTFTSITEAE